MTSGFRAPHQQCLAPWGQASPDQIFLHQNQLYTSSTCSRRDQSFRKSWHRLLFYDTARQRHFLSNNPVFWTLGNIFLQRRILLRLQSHWACPIGTTSPHSGYILSMFLLMNDMPRSITTNNFSTTTKPVLVTCCPSCLRSLIIPATWSGVSAANRSHFGLISFTSSQ